MRAAGRQPAAADFGRGGLFGGQSADDAALLAQAYAPEVAVGADVLAHIVDIAHGSVRRVTVNLVNLAEAAAVAGVDTLDMAALKRLPGFEFYRGESPKRGVNMRMVF